MDHSGESERPLEARHTYQSLNASFSEIRLISFVPDSALPVGLQDYVNISLDNFSLEDYAPDCLDFSRHFQNRDGISNDAWYSYIRQHHRDLAEVDPILSFQFKRFTWGEFRALSYSWDSQKYQRPIVINRRLVQVGGNLEACLRTLRNKPEYDFHQGRRKLWVDALCIDQENIPERNREVSRMKEIYSLCEDVVVWLGSSKDDSDVAMSFLNQLSREVFDPSGRMSRRGRAEDAKKMIVDLHNDMDYFSKNGEETFAPLYLLLARSYWTRCWVIQELAHTTPNTKVYCGESGTYWYCFIDLMMCLEAGEDFFRYVFIQHLKRYGADSENLVFSYLIYRFLRIEEYARSDFSSKERLWELLQMARKANITDPRDKIYSLMGLMDQSLANFIRPDYGRSILYTYSQFATKLIQTAPFGLNIICQGNGIREQEWPSWVPNFMIRATFAKLDHEFFYTASRTELGDVSFPNTGELKAFGICVDTVDGLGAKFRDDGLEKPFVFESHVPAKGSANAYGSQEKVREALWRTLVGDRDKNGRMAMPNQNVILDIPWWDTPADSPALEEALQKQGWSNPNIMLRDETWNGFRTHNASFSILGAPLKDFFRDKVGRCADFGIILDVLNRLWEMLNARRMLVSEKGRIGWVPWNTLPGDLIYVLIGCSMPVVLRPHGRGRFRVLGECYLHGIMNGEGLGNGSETVNVEQARHELILC